MAEPEVSLEKIASSRLQFEPEKKWTAEELEKDAQNSLQSNQVKTATAKNILCDWENPNFKCEQKIIDLGVGSTRQQKVK